MQKDYLLTLFCSVLFFVASSQNLEVLDSRGGFKGFKIGASAKSIMDSHSTNLELLNTETDREGKEHKVYKYNIENDPLSAFGYMVFFLQLDFKSNVLYNIHIEIGHSLGKKFTDEGDFNNIFISIKQAFGKPTIERKNVSQEYEWQGKKIKLTLLGNQNDDGYLIYISLDPSQKGKIDF